MSFAYFRMYELKFFGDDVEHADAFSENQVWLSSYGQFMVSFSYQQGHLSITHYCKTLIFQQIWLYTPINSNISLNFIFNPFHLTPSTSKAQSTIKSLTTNVKSSPFMIKCFKIIVPLSLDNSNKKSTTNSIPSCCYCCFTY